MAKSYRFELPWPPSINDYYGRTRRGQVFIKQPGRDFRSRVVALVRPGVGEAITGPVKVSIHAVAPDHRRRDLDNIEKPLLDALQHAGVYANDYQIKVKFIERIGVLKGRGGVVVIVEETD